MASHVVKRKGHTERFDERKVYASCYAACLASHVPHHLAEKIAEHVTSDVKRWIREKKTITSHSIFLMVAKSMAEYSKDAAYMYKTHRDIA